MYKLFIDHPEYKVRCEKERLLRSPTHINGVIVHCSDFDGEHGIRDIDDWHRKRGWICCGYHYVIDKKGVLSEGRPADVIGSHCLDHNAKTLGVCVLGKRKFTGEQSDALNKLLPVLFEYVYSRGGWISYVVGHRRFTDKKTCPNFRVSEFLRTKTIRYELEGN